MSLLYNCFNCGEVRDVADSFIQKCSDAGCEYYTSSIFNVILVVDELWTLVGDKKISIQMKAHTSNWTEMFK